MKKALGQALADEGIEQAGSGADPQWMRAALQQVRWLCTVRATFTADDVWALLHDTGVGTGEPRAMGAVMRQARAAGICQPTARFVPSVRPEAHCGPKRVWAAL